MFKKHQNNELEIYSSMQKSLVCNQLNHKYAFEKIEKVVDYINNAAELLDDTGFTVEADMLTKVLKRLANEQDENSSQIHHADSIHHADVPEEIIIEPLNQEIEIEPLFEPNEILDGVPSKEHEILTFKSIAEVAAKIMSKKKV